MTEFQKIKSQIDPHIQPDKQFFLNLLEENVQRQYEDEHIKAVMTMLKVLHLNKLKRAISACKEEREKINSASFSRAENYKRVLEIDAELKALNEKMLTFRPFFDEPYFARMDVEDDKEGYNSYYIGKRGDEGLEIVDWRAPLARKYYQKSRTCFSINEYDYKLILRRALRTGNGKILDMKNEYLSLKDYLSAEEIDGRDESLIFDPFLKEILNSRKEKREITDIIETIQEKQYEIITLPERAEFILQGVAGSGKTMIMLHRLSYILYNNETLRPSDIMVITPSDSFNAFIDELSAILELEKVKTSTLDSYFLKVLKSAGADIKDRIDYSQPVPENFSSYVYSDKFLDDVRKKLGKIFDGVHGLLTSEECSGLCSDIINSSKKQIAEYSFIKNASLRVRRCVLGEIKEKADGGLFYTKRFRYMFNCVNEVKEFLASLNEERMNGYAYFYKQLLSFYKALKYLRKYAEAICVTAIGELKQLSVTVDKEIEDLKRYKTNIGDKKTYTYADRIAKREELKKETETVIGRIERILFDFSKIYDFAEVLKTDTYLVSIGKSETTLDILRFFYKETLKRTKKHFGMSTKKLCKSDPFALCLLLSELGFPLSPKYSFVFVDEAQDISAVEYGLLKRINDRASFNIFGDLKQNVTDYRGIKDWSELGYEVYNLNLNYRNTNQIVEYVSGNLGVNMQSIGFDGEKVEKIDSRSVTKFLSGHSGLLAVVTSGSDIENYRRKSYNVLSETGRISKSKINIMTVYESKGLEFTAVAVADANMTENEKYIAYTRALKNLAIITN